MPVRALAAVLAVLSVAAALPSAGSGDARVTLLQRAPAPGNGPSGNAAVSADGRFVAIASGASDLVRGDTNGVFDVFVRDVARRTTERVSISTAGVQANARTGLSAISADGRFVVMWSDASNLVAGDANDVTDVFVRDRVGGTTERVSISSDGTQADAESAHGAISADGRFVAFASRASNLGGGEADVFDVFLRDRATGRTELVGPGWWPAITSDGRFVAFEGGTSALGRAGIFVLDRTTDVNELVSVGTEGRPANDVSYTPSISADGRFVAFVSEASNLVPDDTNGPRRGGADIFVRDLVRGTTERVSVATDGAQANKASQSPTITADGQAVAFTSFASNLGTISGGGVFVRERTARATELVSVSTGGSAANSDSYTGTGPLSANGRVVAFVSLGSNLVPGDTNNTHDVFVRDRTRQTTELVSVARSRQPSAGRLTLRPNPPRAGRPFTATLPVNVDGDPVPGAAVGCTATIGGKQLKTSAKSFQASRARCIWRLPSNAKGRQLRGAVSARTSFGRAVKTFAARVR